MILIIRRSFGNHWARRKADQVARDTRELTGTTEELIDEYFGWLQKHEASKEEATAALQR